MPNPTPTFGIQLTGYLHKQTARKMTRSWERRFTVLTKVGMHWFRRSDGYDMFGEETGHVMLTDITSVGPHEEVMAAGMALKLFDSSSNDLIDEESAGKYSPTTDSNEKIKVFSFRVKTKDGYTRTFRCSKEEERERWIEAITMTIAQINYEAEQRASTPLEMSKLELERKESINGVDFAPVGSPFKKPKYLFHSQMGGTCWGGAAPPEPTLITCSGRLAKSLGETGDASWGEAGSIEVQVAEKGTVEIHLTNGGRCSIHYEKLVEMAKLNATSEEKELKASDLEGEKLDVTGYRYPGDPLLVCRISVAAVNKPDAKSTSQKWFSVPIMAAALVFQPLALMAASALASNSSSSPLIASISPFLPPALSIEQGFSTCLLLNAVPFILHTLTSILAKKSISKTFDLILQTYEESEASIHSDDLEKPVPSRFVAGCKNDPPGTAEKRWATTVAWRKREKVDTVILEAHPLYNEIKVCYPHFYCRSDLSGKQVCYFERPGFLALKRLEEIGVQKMVRHYIWQVEFCWTYMSTSAEDTRTLSGVDVQNVGLYDLKGVVKEFLGAISKVSQEHYPERAGKICILNAPGWFSMLWNVIKLTLHPNTQKKVFILSESAAKKTMKTLIDHESVPIEYGGGLKFPSNAPAVEKDFPGPLGKEKEKARFCSEYEVAINDYVKRLNSKQKLPRPPAYAWEREDVLIEKEDFLKAYEHGWEDFESQLHLPKEKWDPNGWPGILFKD